jgi:hypothetical protein
MIDEMIDNLSKEWVKNRKTVNTLTGLKQKIEAL